MILLLGVFGCNRWIDEEVWCCPRGASESLNSSVSSCMVLPVGRWSTSPMRSLVFTSIIDRYRSVVCCHVLSVACIHTHHYWRQQRGMASLYLFCVCLPATTV